MLNQQTADQHHKGGEKSISLNIYICTTAAGYAFE